MKRKTLLVFNLLLLVAGGVLVWAYQVSPVGKPSKVKLTEELVFYGLVIDEKSNTVSGASVEANGLISSPTQTQHREIVQTTSDVDGRFDLHIPWGQQVMVTVTGSTNYINPPPQRFQYGPVGSDPIHQPNFSEPVIFKLTKKQIEDSFFKFSRWWGAPNNGEPVQIDLSTGQSVNQNGDLVISIFCPEPYSEEKRFPWKLSIQVSHGGLVAAAEDQLEFMLLAPENGYEQTLSWEYGPGIEPWRAQHQGTYYLTARNGQFFAKLAFRMNTKWDIRGVPFYTQVTVNTNGSRNLQAP